MVDHEVNRGTGRLPLSCKEGDYPAEGGHPLTATLGTWAAPSAPPFAICHLPRPAPGDSLWNRAGGGITLVQVTPATRLVS
jgi:hypothetical protein